MFEGIAIQEIMILINRVLVETTKALKANYLFTYNDKQVTYYLVFHKELSDSMDTICDGEDDHEINVV